MKMTKTNEDHLKSLVSIVLEANKTKGLIPLKQQEDRIMAACGTYLKSKGYRINRPDYKLSAQPKNIKDLVEYYCKVLNEYYPSRFLSVDDKKEATMIMRALVESRESVAFNRKAALAEAATIIFTVFDKEKYLGLRIPPDIRSFNVNSTRKWIVDRAIDLINDMNLLAREEEDEAECDRLADDELQRMQEAGEPVGWADLDELVK